MKRVQSESVQQVADCTLWKHKGRWIDARLAKKSLDTIKADRTVEFGTKGYFDLAHKLAKQNRNALFCFDGDALIEVDGKAVLIKGPSLANATPKNK